MNADLHCHSRVSDGSLTVSELAAYAKRRGIHTLAFAEHDTTAGWHEAEKECRKQGLRHIPAIEISAYDYKRMRKAHVLGYLMDRPEAVSLACQPMVAQRQETAKWMVAVLADAGYPLTWELVESLAAGSTNVYKQHVMHALMELGFAVSIHDELYCQLFAPPRDGRPGGIAYREIEYLDAAAAVSAIKNSGGISVLAHPAGYGNLELVPELIDAGLDGLEAWHPLHDAAAVKEIEELARRYDLLLTGGSDFHGMYEGKRNPVGSCLTPPEWLEALFNRKAS